MEFLASFLPLLIIRTATLMSLPTQQDSPSTSPTIDITSICQSPGPAIAGQNYSLECSVTVTPGSADQLIILWMGNQGTEIIPEISGSDGSYSSTLTFSPLRASDAGTYMCNATLGDLDAMDTATVDITVQSKCHSCSRHPMCIIF